MKPFNKVYSAIYGSAWPFSDLAENGGDDVVDPKQMTAENSALVLWGGQDIGPHLYSHPVSRRTHASAPRRDWGEWKLLQAAIKKNMAIIGICRGAQMLCAAEGGFLLQDVQKHAGPGHDVTTVDGKHFGVNSLHHQMMAGFQGTDHELVAWASHNQGEPYVYMDDKPYRPTIGWKEPEFIYFRKIRGYAIQWHPEGMMKISPATEYIFDYITKTEKERVPHVVA